MAGEKQEYTVLNEQKLKKYNQRKCANLILGHSFGENLKDLVKD